MKKKKLYNKTIQIANNNIKKQSNEAIGKYILERE